MRKIYISFIFLLISNLSYSLNVEKGKEELKSIKKELILKYKKELGADYSNFSNSSSNEKRAFYENLYLKFLGKYIIDLKDVKVYTGPDVNNVMLFANTPIEKSTFEDIYKILSIEESNKKLKLIQVPENNRGKFYGIIQEKISERE
ncbi:hypothetical protein [Pseudostreptobacillus hongkongensis]|uniref:hypothetical protein n=1 Tax=Pseudostreptobacillus hongkongensis TaxID=1162717 RepID=UPI0028D5F977|nr:hypothetical protein [Pseudostreptobacillus hongkongensis]